MKNSLDSVENERPGTEKMRKLYLLLSAIGSMKLGFELHSRTGKVNIGATLDYRLRKRKVEK